MAAGDTRRQNICSYGIGFILLIQPQNQKEIIWRRFPFLLSFEIFDSYSLLTDNAHESACTLINNNLHDRN